ncbi:MAG: hypothetical protein CVU57_04240 [Deltaproteobacteria bacterium HGW-Deltaproteobacteria-15]|jgi:hypothetical protein|nr:MAG: hypothetical protein CVU57_04240 [Deltaproteobacteria bacterium HGW-Deltaproteobacteria-15]
MEIGDRVKMTRRPFFSGTIRGEQMSLLEKCRSFLISWSFKPHEWVSKRPVKESDLARVKE